MKKLFTSMAMALMLMAVPAQAQVKFGLTGGLNLTSLSVSTDGEAAEIVQNNLKNKAGFFVGPTVKFTLPIVGLGIDASAFYDQREAETNDGEKLKTQSLMVPINVRYGVGLGSVASVFAFVGPQFGFNLGDDTKSLKDVGNSAREWTLKSSNFSINLGVGALLLTHLQARINYNVAMGKTGEIQMRNIGDATSVVQDAALNAAGALTGIKKTKANSWQVSLTYFF